MSVQKSVAQPTNEQWKPRGAQIQYLPVKTSGVNEMTLKPVSSSVQICFVQKIGTYYRLKQLSQFNVMQ